MRATDQPQSQRDTQCRAIRRATVYSRGTSQSTGRSFNYTLRFLDTGDVDRLCRLQATVLATLSAPLPIYKRDPAFFTACVTTRGCVVGALANNHLVGYATLFFPSVFDTNYGRDLGLRDVEMSNVSHLAGSVTHPRYRGNRLQSRLVAMRDSFAAQAGYHHLCGEVVPGNTTSMQNHFANGYFLKGFRIDQFGDPNYILHKDLLQNPLRVPYGAERLAPVHDITTYRAMLDRGYWGFRIICSAGEWYLAFAKFAAQPPC